MNWKEDIILAIFTLWTFLLAIFLNNNIPLFLAIYMISLSPLYFLISKELKRINKHGGGD